MASTSAAGGDPARLRGLALLAHLVAMVTPGDAAGSVGTSGPSTRAEATRRRRAAAAAAERASSAPPPSEPPSEPSSEPPSARPPDPPREPPREVDLRDSGAESARVEALVLLAQRGDADAFGQLYEHYVDSVYRYVYARVGQVSLAEDITSETFLKALRRLDSFSWQGRDIAAWFITIARNLITDHRRSSRFRLEISTDEMLVVEHHREHVASGQPTATPEDVALVHDRDRALLEAVKQLRPDQQECVVLRFFHDFTIAQMAHALGRSEGAVKQLQLRATKALAEIMAVAP